MIKGAIDIGTNTTHLLIAIVVNDKIEEIIYRKRFYVYLAEDGIEKISVGAQERLLKSLYYFDAKLKEYGCQQIKITGTEALRKAKNGQSIRNTIKSNLGFDIETISGQEEAQYIYNGVSQIIDLNSRSNLIVDIGGGSVEFIHCHLSKIQSLQSHTIGIANLFNQFHKSEPITNNEILLINNHLNNIIGPFLKRLKELNTQFIGSAGTFEVFSDDMSTSNSKINLATVSKDTFLNYYNKSIHLNLEERVSAKHIPSDRVKYIIVALILVKYLIEALECNEFKVSRYALKEGVIVS